MTAATTPKRYKINETNQPRIVDPERAQLMLVIKHLEK